MSNQSIKQAFERFWKHTADLISDTSEKLETRLEELEDGTSNIPNYIVEEAERVAKAVQSVRTSKTLVFSAMSDIHLYEGSTVEQHINSLVSAQSGGLGLKEIQKRLNLDFVSLLGDYSYMSSNNYNANQVMNDITLAKKTLNITEDKQAWCVGNHDWCYGTGVDRMLTPDELYAFVGSNSDGIKPYESIERCFGYLDFDNQKIRVIYLNTNDCKDGIDNGTNYSYMEMISPTQMRWLGDVALNFTDKDDSSEWGVVILSHQPIDYGYAWYTRVLELLEAYRGSKKVTLFCAEYIKDGTTVGHNEVFDFTGIENPAEIICNVHGHIHNCASKKVSSSDSVTPWLWRFCVPNMCFGRYNEKYDTKWGEVDVNGNKVEWVKELGTAKETSFNIVSIDRKNKKIYAHIFGAGKDRVFSYDSQYVPQEYTITTTLSNCTSASGNPTSITEGLGASLVFTANSGYELPTQISVSGATYIWNNTTGTLTLSNPTSNVAITITANFIKPKYTNQIPISTDIDGSIYNGVGYKAGLYISNGVITNSSSQQDIVTGFIPVPIPTNRKEFGQVVIRLKNIETPISFGHFRIGLYLEDKSTKGGYSLSSQNSGNISGASLDGEGVMPVQPYYDVDENGYVTMLDISGALAYFSVTAKTPIHYIRICAKGIDEDSIITVNEEIV